MSVYLLAFEGVKNCCRNFANLWVGLPMTERIGQKGGSPLQVSV